MSDPVTDLEAEVTAGTITSPLVLQIQAGLSAIAKMQTAASGGTPAALTDTEAAALPLVAQHAGGSGDAVSGFAGALMVPSTPEATPEATPAVVFGLAHAQASLTALALGAASVFGVT